MSYTRAASHAGPRGRGWYESDPSRLARCVDECLARASEATAAYASAAASTAAARAELQRGGRLLGVIAPHAGLAYSGVTAATAYDLVRRYIYGLPYNSSDEDGHNMSDKSNNNKQQQHQQHNHPGAQLQRIFVLGPAHHKAIRGVELSAAATYDTPLGPLAVDTAAVAEVHAALRAHKLPAALTARNTDEDEHSIEMHMPFLAHILHRPPQQSPLPPSSSTASATPVATMTAAAAARIRLVPIIVGSVDRNVEQALSRVLQPYMADARNLFVFSSDFCHWGERFGYTYHYERSAHPAIADAIIAMDHRGMRTLEAGDVEAWYAYLDATDNTICGRHPISVGVWQWAKSALHATVRFVGYAQSNRCADAHDSSVSYAAAVITLPPRA